MGDGAGEVHASTLAGGLQLTGLRAGLAYRLVGLVRKTDRVRTLCEPVVLVSRALQMGRTDSRP